MGKEKARDRSGWFKCRFCHVYIQGLMVFVKHKREMHSEELFGNGQVILKQEETKENSLRYRPGPKSMKPQLLIQSKSGLSEPQSGSELIPLTTPVMPALNLEHIPFTEVELVERLSSTFSAGVQGITVESRTRNAKPESQEHEETCFSDTMSRTKGKNSTNSDNVVDEDADVLLIYDDAHDLELKFKAPRAAAVPSKTCCDANCDPNDAICDSFSPSSGDLETIPQSDGLKLLSTECSAMQRADDPACTTVVRDSGRTGNHKLLRNGLGQALIVTTKDISQPAATATTEGFTVCNLTASSSSFTNENFVLQTSTSPTKSCRYLQPPTDKNNLTCSDNVSISMNSLRSTSTPCVTAPNCKVVATISQVPEAQTHLKENLSTKKEGPLRNSIGYHVVPIPMNGLPNSRIYGLNSSRGTIPHSQSNEKCAFKDSTDSNKDRFYPPASKMFSSLDYTQHRFSSQKFVCFNVTSHEASFAKYQSTKAGTDSRFSGSPVIGQILPVCRSIFPKEVECLIPLDQVVKKLDMSSFKEELFKKNTERATYKSLQVADKDLLKTELEQECGAITGTFDANDTSKAANAVSNSGEATAKILQSGRVVRRASSSTFKCRICTESFSSKIDQHKHWKKEHGNFLPYQCQTCLESFAKERMLATHMLTHEEDECKTCGTKFSAKGDYDNHVKLHKKLAASKTKSVESVESPKTDLLIPEPEMTSKYTNTVLPLVFGEAKAIAAVIHREESGFKCPFCVTSCTTSKLLERHLRLRTRELSYCRYCPATFQRVSQRSAHENSQHNHQLKATIYLCRFCPVAFKRLKQRKMHEIMHSENTSVACRSCPRFFENLMLLKRHEILRHSVIPKPFPSASNLKDVTCKFGDRLGSDNEEATGSSDVPEHFPPFHDVVAEQNTKLECKFCHKPFVWYKKLIAHEFVHKGDTPYECRYCDRQFTEVESRNVHQDLHTNPRPYSCHFCATSFCDSKTQWEHEGNCSEKPLMPGRKKGVPKRSGSYRCNYCDAVFENSILLEYHKNWHTGNNPFKCSICEESFPMPSYRRFHIMKVHKLKGFNLTENFYTTENQAAATKPPRGRPLASSKRSNGIKVYRKSGINSLQPTSEADQLPSTVTSLGHAAYFTNGKYQCKKCKKCFTRKGNYINHVLKHDAKKCYQCTTCSKKYTRFSSFYKHRKTHLAKPYACIICSRKFSTDSNLQTHSRIHSRPFPCSHCGKTFDLEFELDDHVLRRHTKDNSFQCPKCLRAFIGSQSYWRHISKNVCASSKIKHASPAVETPIQQDCTIQVGAATENGLSCDETMEYKRVGICEESEEFFQCEEEIDTEFYFKCAICNTEFTDQEQTRKHIDWHRMEFQNAGESRQ